MRLRVSKTGVVFYDLCPLVSQHKPKIKYAFKGPALFIHSIDCRQNYFIHYLVFDFFRIYSRRRESTHTAGVESFVIVVCSLVVSCIDHRHDSFAVAERKYRHFLSHHKLFDNYSLARVFKLAVHHHLFCSQQTFFDVIANYHALAKRKSVSLYYKRILGFCKILHRIVVTVEFFVLSGWYVVFLHQIFRKRLTCLNDCRIGSRSKSPVTSLFQSVYKSCRKRIVGSDHRQLYILMRVHKINYSVKVHYSDRYAFRYLAYSSVARQTIYLADLWTFCKRPTNRVFSSAASYYQYVHILFSFYCCFYIVVILLLSQFDYKQYIVTFSVGDLSVRNDLGIVMSFRA